MIEFPARPVIDQTLAARRRIWQSRCGRFRVAHHRCLYGPRRGRQAIRDVWYALRLTSWGWDVISRHRIRGPAVDACQRAARTLVVESG